MAIFKCKMCGGALEIQDGSSVAVCSFCGTKQTIPKLDNETRTNLYDRANHFRRNNDYDKAMLIYEQLLDADKTDAEAYWSILLCKYGVEYVEDPKTHKMMPTINRAQYTSIFADEDYKSAIHYADGYQREVYENEAKELDEIQKGILAISQKEEPFDIFICYKETDSHGRRTQDSVLAQDLYYQLTQEGYKVFFSRITLEDKLGTAYEPYIFAALNTAKIMVVIGTSKENLNSVWVKNEWSRFLALTKKDGAKVLIPAYRDMDPYDLPDEFSHLQAQDMSKLGFMQDLIRGIKKILAKDEKIVVMPQNNATNSNGNVDTLLKRAYIACEDGDFAKADSFAEKVLNINPELADAYIVKLLAECKVRRIDDLRTYNSIIKSKTNFQRAYKYAKSDLKSQLTAISKENIEYINYYPIYSKAKGYIENALYSDALVLLEKIPNYKDSATLIAQCKEKAESLKKENAYNQAISVGFARDADEAAMLKSIETLKSLNGYKDSSAQIDKLYARVDKYRYQRQVEVEKEEELNNQQKHRRKIGAIITTTCVIVLVAVLLMTFLLFVPLSNYNKAEDLVKNGDYKTALEKYKELDGFSDSNARVDALTTVIAAQEYFRSGYIMSGITELLSKIPSLTIRYNCSNGQISQEDESSTATVEYKKGDTLKTPYRTGYDFSKWRIVEYYVIYDFTNISASLTLEAEWNKHEYSISYNMNGGVLAQKPLGYNYDSDDIKIGSPSREGYSFVGWSGTGIDGMVPEITIKHNSLGDMSFVANWQANTYTITFSDIYDTTINNTTQDVVFDSIVSLPIPTRVGYTFGGWFTDADLSEACVNYQMPSNDINVYAWWTEENKPTDFVFSGEGQYSISAYVGTQTEMMIPAYIGGIPVTSIGYRAFYDVTNITKASVPDTVESIGSGAFSSGANITEITIPFIGQKADGKYPFGFIFGGSNGLAVYQAGTTYRIPYSLKKVGITKQTWIQSCAFVNCANFEEIVLPTTITTVGKEAFYGCSSLKQINLGNEVESIGTSAFYGCSSLNNIDVPQNTEIKDYAFDETGIVKSKNGVIYIGGTLYKYNGTMPQNYTLNINEGTVVVNKYAFQGCSGLTKIIFPNSLKRIETNAFKDCTSLAELTIPNSLQQIGYQAFYGCNALTSVSIPFVGYELNSNEYFNVIFGKVPTKLANVKITGSISKISANAFSGCGNIKSVVLPDTVESIGENAFKGCATLNSINIPDNVTEIGQYAFYGCSSLVDVTLPNKLTKLPSYCFYGCTKLETVQLPSSLEEIGQYAFQNCSSLKSIIIPSEVKIIGSHAFGGCTSLTTVTFNGEKLENIGSYAFQGCSTLSEIIISASVVMVGEYAFSECPNLVIKYNGLSIPTTWDYNWNVDENTVEYV